METDLIYFIYGLCVMFYGMMAWFFYRKGADRLSRLVMLLMAILAAGCVKDVFFIPMADGHDTFYGPHCRLLTWWLFLFMLLSLLNYAARDG